MVKTDFLILKTLKYAILSSMTEVDSFGKIDPETYFITMTVFMAETNFLELDDPSESDLRVSSNVACYDWLYTLK